MRYDFSVSKIYENGHYLTLTSLWIPKFFEAIFINMIGTVNTLMLSGYSQEAVAATSIAGQILNIAIVLLSMVISGAVVLISIELGCKNNKKAGNLAGTAIILCIITSVLIGGIIVVCASPLVSLMNLEGSAKDICVEFLKIKAIFLPVTILMSCFNNLLICNGYAVCTLGVGLVSNVLNCLFGYIVLYSGISLPVDGIQGVAFAGIAAQFVALINAIILIKLKKCPLSLKLEPKAVLKILKIGIPGGMCSFSFTAAQIITTGFMAQLGILTVNAKVYIANIVSYTQQLSLAIGKGNSILIGRYRGSRSFDKIKILFSQNLRIVIVVNLLLSTLVFAFHKQLIGLFTKDMSIIAISGAVMMIDIFVEGARAVNHIGEQALNANADVKTTLFASIISCWLFSVLLSYILGIKLGLGLFGCWIAFAADEMFKALIYLIRWKSAKWQNTKI